MRDRSGEPTEQNPAQRVTIVVPVYGDWSSLHACVRALIDHADPLRYDVLLVNDNGPDADEIEAGLLGLTAGRAQFRYERNPENLGFVRTCNRAVFELDQTDNDILLLNSDAVVTAGALDELHAVLHADAQHAAVCPRSNDATIASMPFYRRDPGAPLDAERAREVYMAVSGLLPRYYLAPVAVGFCLMLRREVLRRHGLFDEVFGAGYSEENDLCLRLNALGFSSVIANRAFVYHGGSASFGAERRQALDARNSRIVVERYPFYPASVVTFIQTGYHPLDRFADLLVPTTEPRQPSVLITLDQDGDREKATHRLGELRQMLVRLAPHARITVAIENAGPDEASVLAPDAHDLSVGNLELGEAVFDVGVSIGVPSTTKHLTALNRHCLQWAIKADISTELRSWRSRTESPGRLPVTSIALSAADTIWWRSDDDRAETSRVLQLAPQSRPTSLSGGTDESGLWPLGMVPRATVSLRKRLEHRDSLVLPLSLVAESARREGAEATRAAVSESRTYRLAQALRRAPRRLRRR